MRPTSPRFAHARPFLELRARTATALAALALAAPAFAGLAQAEVPADLRAVVVDASRRLVELQENMDAPDAPAVEWPYEGVYRTAGQIPPGYRVGGTAIGAWALLETPGFALESEAGRALLRGLEFVLTQVESNERLGQGFRGSYDVRGWGQAYALQFLLRLRAKELTPEAERERVDRTIRRLIQLLQDSAIPETGGWNYARNGGAGKAVGASPFMTGPTLLALFEAAAQGEPVDAKVVELALDALESGRSDDSIMSYNSYRKGGDTQAGSTGRRPITELALIAAGRADASGLAPALDAFLEHWGELEKRRRQTGTHKPPHGIAPYYFYYAHFYAALAIEGLPVAQRPAYRTRFLERLFEVREKSGGWNDRVFDRSENYGTAMSLLALMAPTLPAPAGWKPVGEVQSKR